MKKEIVNGKHKAERTVNSRGSSNRPKIATAISKKNVILNESSEVK